MENSVANYLMNTEKKATKKVIFIEHNINIGGSVISLLNMAKLIKENYEVIIYCFKGSKFINLYKRAELKVYELPFKIFEKSMLFLVINLLWLPRGKRLILEMFKMIFYTLPIMFKFYRLFKKEQPDLIHVNNSLRFNRAEILAAYFARIPCICHVRQIHRCTWIDLWVARNVSCFIAVSQAVKQNYIKWGIPEDRIELLYNASDLNLFKPYCKAGQIRLRQHLGLNENYIYILAAGRLISKKGFEYLFQVLAEVIYEYPHVRALIVGEGPDSDHLQNLVQKLSLKDYIFFIGCVDNMQDYYNLVDIVVQYSVEPDPFPRVVIEAMACGRPVIGSNSGGIGEAIDDGKTGLLIPLGDVNSLKNALMKLIDDANKRTEMGINARKKAEQLYDIKKYADKLYKIYKEIL